MLDQTQRVMQVERTWIVKSPHVLVLQRAALDKNQPLGWEVPGGKVETGQSRAEALRREIEEETGLLIQTIDNIVHWEYDVLRGGRYDGVRRETRYTISHIIGGRLRLSTEHLDHRWCRHRELQHLRLTQETRNAERALQQHLRPAGLR